MWYHIKMHRTSWQGQQRWLADPNSKMNIDRKACAHPSYFLHFQSCLTTSLTNLSYLVSDLFLQQPRKSYLSFKYRVSFGLIGNCENKLKIKENIENIYIKKKLYSITNYNHIIHISVKLGLVVVSRRTYGPKIILGNISILTLL